MGIPEFFSDFQNMSSSDVAWIKQLVCQQSLRAGLAVCCVVILLIRGVSGPGRRLLARSIRTVAMDRGIALPITRKDQARQAACASACAGRQINAQ